MYISQSNFIFVTCVTIYFPNQMNLLKSNDISEGFSINVIVTVMHCYHGSIWFHGIVLIGLYQNTL